VEFGDRFQTKLYFPPNDAVAVSPTTPPGNFPSLRVHPNRRPFLTAHPEKPWPREISERLGLLERTVYRRLERVKARLERLRAGAASSGG
jgi:hypothetical protein